MQEDEEVRTVVEEVAAKKNSLRLGSGPGESRLLFAMTAGSVAFNLSLPSSDRDYFAVYVADTRQVLGLTRPVATIDCHDPDLQLYEAARYCELLLKGNPKAQHFAWQSEEWRELKKLRHHLMTQVTLDQYVSYSLSQVGDYLKGRGPAPPPKKFYHAIRLMQEAKRIITHGAPRVWYDDTDEEREALLAIRRGEKNVDDLVERLHAYRDELESLKTKLPEKTDPSVLSEWLVYLRRKLLNETKPSEPNPTDDLVGGGSSGNLDLRDKALDLLRQFDVEGQIVCCIPSGSQAHGLRSAEEKAEDADYIAVYAAPTTAVIGLAQPPQRVDALGPDSKQRETYARGMVIFEAGYACQLLAQGNHRLLEALFFDEQKSGLTSYQTPAWRKLKTEAGSSLIAQTALNHYLGVAQGQLQTRPLTRVHLYHAFRLLAEAEHMIEHRLPPQVTLPHEQRAFLQLVRAPQHDGATEGGEYSVNALLQRAKDQATALASRKDALPRTLDREPLDRWLSSLRCFLLVSSSI